jgi:hypothetical protein
MTNPLLSVRLRPSVLKEADDLIDKLKEHPAYAHSRITRTGVIRIAILKGLRLLQKETAKL